MYVTWGLERASTQKFYWAYIIIFNLSSVFQVISIIILRGNFDSFDLETKSVIGHLIFWSFNFSSKEVVEIKILSVSFYCIDKETSP